MVNLQLDSVLRSVRLFPHSFINTVVKKSSVDKQKFVMTAFMTYLYNFAGYRNLALYAVLQISVGVALQVCKIGLNQMHEDRKKTNRKVQRVPQSQAAVKVKK